MNTCEALVLTQGVGRRPMYVACGALRPDLHHKLTRGRGGMVLDKAGETYHHMWLCRDHHSVAHDQGSAFDNGLLIRGSVVTGPDGRPVYTGPDTYLSRKYGAQHADI
jgi:hypothetical protein